MIECSNCGCTDFALDWAGPHIKAVCKSCGERFKTQQGNSTHYFVSVTDESARQPATEKQIKFAKNLVWQNGDKMSKELACDIIASLK